MKSISKRACFGAPFFRPRKFGYFFLVAFLTGLTGCQSSSAPDLNSTKAAEGFSPQETDKLFIVDCLLPGQVRKLGSQMTYFSARRPVKTTAGDCEIRGGEYVAYDRANYASALKVWLPQAQQGDTEAQVTLGEIYEKGLGGIADPALAAEWYLKAAKQGNSRAQINLGYLYEKGLGVKQDKVTALNWYRKASGLESSDLQFATVTDIALPSGNQQELEKLRQQSQVYKAEAENLRKQLEKTDVTDTAVPSGNQQELEKLRQQSEVYKAEAENLRKQLERTEIQLSSEKEKLLTIKKQLNDTLNKLNQEQGKSTRNEKLIKSLQKDMEIKQASLNSQQQQVAQIENKIKKEQIQISAKSDTESIPKTAKISQPRKKTQQAVSKKKSKADKTTVPKATTISAQAGPVIEIIDPPIALTRSTPSYQLRSNSSTKEISGKVISTSGIKSLEINQQVIQTDPNGLFRSEVAVVQPSTEVTVVATDKQGNSSIMSFYLLTQSEDAIPVPEEEPESTISSSYPSIDFGRFYALIIGNNQYENMPTLKTSVNDAKAIDEILRTRYGYKTTLLINATRHQIMTSLNNLRNKLTENDNLVIYYAGHGDIDKSDQSAYWLPTDAEANNPANWLSSHNITQYLNVIAAKHILVIADSCYSGAMTTSSIVRIPKDMPENKREKWLNFMINRKARTVMTSGGVEPVVDTGSGNHSIFANALLKALRSNTGLMEDYKLFRAIASKVKKSASSIGFKQIPQYSAMQHAGHEGSPFFFVPKS